MIVLMIVIIIVLLLSFLLYRFAFATGEKERGDVHVPSHGPYAPLYERMVLDVDTVKKADWEWISITSKDGLKLYGRLEKGKENMPVMMFFHGWRGHAFFDGCPAYMIAHALAYNIILVDQRGHGRSEGKCTTMAIRECQDCADWANAVYAEAPDTPIILMGVSMGAAAVLMSADRNLPCTVKGIIADCGFTSPKDILRHCIPSMVPHAPVGLCYQLGRLGALLFGHFDPDRGDARKALAASHIPVLLIHGDIDDFVPWQMSIENQKACAGESRLVLIRNAPHASSWFTDPDTYRKEVLSFLNNIHE
ncbi:MAG: alpha/beta hydrolase [Bulleidia sp.]